MVALSTDEQGTPVHDTPISGLVTRSLVPTAVEYGNDTDFWVEYPNGLVDVSRETHLPDISPPPTGASMPPDIKSTQLDIPVDGNRTVRINKAKTALVVIDMQK